MRRSGLRLTLAIVVLGSLSLAWGQSTTQRPELTKDPTLYVVGYAHLDTQWRWTYKDVIGEMIPKTMHENFRLFELYPEYKFNFSAANIYRMMKEYYPTEFEKVKHYVAAGRWFPSGSSMEECDVMSTGAESIIRQLLYGSHFFRREVGKSSEEFILPDCFGFPASLPTLLNHCTMKGFSTQKLSWGSAKGIPFNVGLWEGVDGSSILAALNATSYNGDIDTDLSSDPAWVKRVQEDGEKSGLYVDFRYYGTGDVGGSPRESSVKMLMQSLHGDGPLHVIAATAEQMFLDIPADETSGLPRCKGDLLLTEHSAGSISSQTQMKRWNRHNEVLGAAAERAALLAEWLGGPAYPQPRLNAAWTLVMGAQFHDILPGTSLPKAYEFSWNDELLAQNQFANMLDSAVGSIATKLDTQAKGVALVVYNPLSIARQDIVEATVPLSGAAAVRVTGPDGQEVPAQVLSADEGKLQIVFVADAPPVGFAVYDVQPAQAAATSSPLKVTENSLENARYRVTLDANGDVGSIFDKIAGRELLSEPARLAIQHENPGAWPAWNMDWADQQKPPRAYVSGPAKVRIVERGPARVALEVTRETEGSNFVQTIRLAAGQAGERVEFANKIDWQGRECCLKAAFPLTVANPMATYNWEVGTVERGNNDPRKYEVPAHQWFDLTDTKGDYGVTVLSDCKYGSDKPDDHTLRLTLLYTPGVRGGYPDQATQDWGHHEFVYGLAGHQHDWRQAQTDWQGVSLNEPLRVFQTTTHAGGLGRTFSLLRVSDPRVRVMALKKAEDSDEVILRLVELDGRPAKDVRVSFAAPIVAAREVDGREQPRAAAKVVNGELVTDLTGYGLRAFALKLGPAPTTLPPTTAQPLDLPYNRCVTSHDGEKAVGGFDDAGQCIPAEMLPAEVTYRGVAFKLGPIEAGQPNAVVCSGQSLKLPSTKANRLYLLAAASNGDQPATITIDGHPTQLKIQDWSGYIGQWDNRVWRSPTTPMDSEWPYEFAGVRRAFLRKDPVAWFCSHHHSAEGVNQIYDYCYLFAYGLDLPAGAQTVTLPSDEHIVVLAATAANDPAVGTFPAHPLSDQLKRDENAPTPTITPAGGTFNDCTPVTMQRPLLGGDCTLRYTLDGSEPTTASPAFDTDFLLFRDTTVKARLFDPHGRGGLVAEARLQINDRTPPSVQNAVAFAWFPEVRLSFSEPLDPVSAEKAVNYSVTGGAKVTAAKLADDGRNVTLTLSAPPEKTDLVLTINGVRDRSPNGNPITNLRRDVASAQPVASLAEGTFDRTSDRFTELKLGPDAPVAGSAPWTINVWLWLDEQPGDLTLIAGFGNAKDQTGRERYIAKFAHGFHFWGSNVDIPGDAQLDVQKWQMLTVTFDGRVLRMFKNGQETTASEAVLNDAVPVAKIDPPPPWGNRGNRFTGKIAGFTLWNEALSPESVLMLEQAGHEAAVH